VLFRSSSASSDLAIANLFSIKVPPENPVQSQPARKIVFVDPDDDNANFFWPAMVIPHKEIKEFQNASGADVDIPGENEYLVAYFEDGSFSVVSEDDVIPFCPYEPPYTSYVSGQNSHKFCSDKGVILATAYWQKSIVPPSFTWLKEENIKAVNKLKMERNWTANADLAVEQVVGGASPASSNHLPTPSNQQKNITPEGTGIFGYEKRRVSQPPQKHTIDHHSSASRKSTAANNTAHPAKKQKTERKIGVKKKGGKLTDEGQFPNIPQQTYTKTQGCDKCYPLPPASPSDVDLISRSLCVECSKLLDDSSTLSAAPVHTYTPYIDSFVQVVASLGPHSRSTNASVNSNVVRLLQRLESFNLAVLMRKDEFGGYF